MAASCPQSSGKPGEKGLEEAIAEDGGKVRAGQTVRLTDISADAGAGLGLFENLHGHASPQAFADAIQQAAARHHGHVVRAFIARVLKEGDTVMAKLSSGLPVYLDKECGDDADGQVRRVAKRFHLCAVAGELASRWGLVPWGKGEAARAAKTCLKAWIARRGGTGAAEDAAVPAGYAVFGTARHQPLSGSGGFRREVHQPRRLPP